MTRMNKKYDLSSRLNLVLCAAALVQTAACTPQPVPRTTDWWKHASDAQIADITYRTFCAPGPEACLPQSEYVVRIARDYEYSFLAVYFLRDKPPKANAISCHTLKGKLVLSCGGDGRKGGSYRGMETPLNYPIIWSTTQGE
jgi:hypothetical protein